MYLVWISKHLLNQHYLFISLPHRQLYNFINKFGHKCYICLSCTTSFSFSRPEINNDHESQHPGRSCENHSNYRDYFLQIESICLNCNDINVGDHQKQISDQKTQQSPIFFSFVSTSSHLNSKSVRNEQQAEQYQFCSDGATVIVEYVVFIDELKILEDECEIRDDFIIVEHDLEIDRKKGLRIGFFLISRKKDHLKCNYKFKFKHRTIQMGDFSLQSLSKVQDDAFSCPQSIFIMIQNKAHMAYQQQSTPLLKIIASKDFFRQIQTIIDKTVTYKRQRWGYLALFYLYVLYRFYIYQYLGLMYIIGLYVIYLIVKYFTPSGLPDPDEDTPQSALLLEQSVSILTSTEGDRPVLRSLNEFNLWKSLCLLGIGSWLCTWFDIFLIPVYWPFLLIYFTWLIGLAVVKHCIHMRKYGYKISDFNSKKPVQVQTTVV